MNLGFAWNFIGRAVCPANEGIETQILLTLRCPAAVKCRAVCPANEGIETNGNRVAIGAYAIGRAVCPANEGIETLRWCQMPGFHCSGPRGLPR